MGSLRSNGPIGNLSRRNRGFIMIYSCVPGDHETLQSNPDTHTAISVGVVDLGVERRRLDIFP